MQIISMGRLVGCEMTDVEWGANETADVLLGTWDSPKHFFFCAGSRLQPLVSAAPAITGPSDARISICHHC